MDKILIPYVYFDLCLYTSMIPTFFFLLHFFSKNFRGFFDGFLFVFSCGEEKLTLLQG